jgi:chromosome segregation ATPase
LATTLTTTKTTLESRISNLEREKAELLPYRESAHDAQREVDRLMRELVEMKQSIRKQLIASPRPTTTAPGTPAEDLRSELRRQASQLTSLQAANNKLHQENQELRARRDNVEMIKSELKNVERKSKEKIRSLMEDLDRARREME